MNAGCMSEIIQILEINGQNNKTVAAATAKQRIFYSFISMCPSNQFA